MTEELTQEQIDGIEAMIKRRMDNTDETRAQSCDHILNYLRQRLPENAWEQ